MSDIVIDQEFVRLLSIHVDRFKQLRPTTWRFRCPFCGDSQKSKAKARCYVYNTGKGLAFHCHNCGEHGGIYKLLEHVSPSLANEYSMQTFVHKGDKASALKYTPKKRAEPTGSLNVSMSNDISLQTVADLPANHPAKIYLNRRKIPDKYIATLYYTDDFLRSAEELKADYNPAMKTDERIIIPVRNDKGVLVAIQGNDFKGQSGLRYITLKVRDEPKIFNADMVDKTKLVMVLEGAYDSMFLPNAVAVLDSSLEKTHYENEILVFDNEPYSKVIIGKMEKAIDHGHTVCIWPKKVREKDVNEMVLAGADPKDISSYIIKNSFSGLRARLELQQWKRV